MKHNEESACQNIIDLWFGYQAQYTIDTDVKETIYSLSPPDFSESTWFQVYKSVSFS